MADEKNVSWFQVNNLVPLIGSAVIVTSSHFMLSNKVDSARQDIGYIKDNITTIATEAKADTDRINNHEIRITLLEKENQTSSVGITDSNLSSIPMSTPAPEPTNPPVADSSAQLANRSPETVVNVHQNSAQSNEKENEPQPDPPGPNENSPVAETVNNLLELVLP